MNKECVTRVFEKLGPERVEQGLAAFADPPELGDDLWVSCFLGLALGITAATTSMRLRDARLSGTEVDNVTIAFDSPVTRPLLHALALEWLEANRAPTKSAPPSEAAHVPMSRVSVAL